jgi:hypothetical protein
LKLALHSIFYNCNRDAILCFESGARIGRIPQYVPFSDSILEAIQNVDFDILVDQLRRVLSHRPPALPCLLQSQDLLQPIPLVDEALWVVERTYLESPTLRSSTSSRCGLRNPRHLFSLRRAWSMPVTTRDCLLEKEPRLLPPTPRLNFVFRSRHLKAKSPRIWLET